MDELGDVMWESQRVLISGFAEAPVWFKRPRWVKQGSGGVTRAYDETRGQTTTRVRYMLFARPPAWNPAGRSPKRVPAPAASG